MCMRRGDRIGSRLVNLGVNGEGCSIHLMVSFDYFALMVDEDQVRDSYLAEVHAEGVNPEVIAKLRIARRYVACDALIKPKA